MTTKTKTIVTIILLVTTGVIYFGYARFKKLKAIFDKLIIKPNSIPRNLDINFKRVRFNIDISIENPTQENFNLQGYIAKITKVKVFYKNEFTGTSEINLSEINIAQKNKIILSNVEIVIEFDKVLLILDNVTNLSINDFTFSALVDVAGNEFEISN